MMQLVVFVLDNWKLALSLQAVIRVLPAVEITPLPNAPDVVSGIVNIEGTLFPVFNTRHCLGFPERDTDPGDRFIIAQTKRRSVILTVDDVTGVLSCSEKCIDTERVLFHGQRHISGVARLDGELILIHDLEAFLSPKEERVLNRAVSEFTEPRQDSDH